MTTGERLAELSPLPVGSALQHLMAIKENFTSLTTGDLLNEVSSIDLGTAIQHLLAVDAIASPYIGGGSFIEDIEFERAFNLTEIEMPDIDIDSAIDINIDMDIDIDIDIINNLEDEDLNFEI